ncbi:MAG: energy transducer TonB [Terriglobales bacterium]|jgi:hypothetical protein
MIIATFLLAFALSLTATAQCASDRLTLKAAALPMYLPIARTAHVTGDVLVAFDIDEHGRTTNVRAMSGSPMLAVSATDNVKSWTLSVTAGVTAAKDCRTLFRYSLSSQETDIPRLQVSFQGVDVVEVHSDPPKPTTNY